MPILAPTGERFLPDFYSGVIALEHLHRYHMALELAGDRDVLDIASGEGYGSNMLMARARSVVGVDIDPNATSHAQQKYGREALSFLCGSATEIPLDDSCVDLAVSFETIEHLEDHETMLAELARVLRPGGVLLISSPNKAIYSDRTNYKNEFHLKELYTDELIRLIKSKFTYVSAFGQKTSAASVISSSEPAPLHIYSGEQTHFTLPENRYDVVLASNEKLPILPNSLFEFRDSPLQPELAELSIKTIRDELSTATTRVAEAETRVLAAETRAAGAETRIVAAETRAAQAARTADAQAYQSILSIAHQLAEDANDVVSSKWWRRTKFFRKWSNSIRKIRGRDKKHWREHFDVGSHHGAVAPIGQIKLTEPVLSKPATFEEFVAIPSMRQKCKPHLTVVAMARNEASRAHDTMRHFCALFDRVLVIDHLSEDETAAIVASYDGVNGTQVVVLRGEDEGYYQSEYMTAAANALICESKSDWVFFIDFDEFLPFRAAADFRQALIPLAKSDVIHSHWYNLSLQNFDQGSLNGADTEIADTVSNYVKIALNLAQLNGQRVAVAQGNHSVSIAGRPNHVGERAFGIFHVPIFSEEAFALKVKQGTKAYEATSGRDESQGTHWRELHAGASSLASNPALTREVALRYGDPLGSIITSLEAGATTGGRDFKLQFAQSEEASPKQTHLQVQSFNLASIDGVMLKIFPPAPPAASVLSYLSDAIYTRLPPRREVLDVAGRELRIQNAILSAPSEIEVVVPTAWSGHKPFLFSLMEAMRPRRYVELGTHNGASFFAACQHYKSNANYGEAIAIDLWEGDHQAGRYDESIFEQFRQRLSFSFPKSGKFIRGYFHEAVTAFEPESIDLLHIDGLHTYRAVQDDFRTWKSRLSPDGVIIFHDTSEYQTDFAVWQLFEEVRGEATASFKFSHCHGLGVMAFGDPSRNPAIELLNHLNKSPEIVENYYSNLGEAMFKAARLRYATAL